MNETIEKLNRLSELQSTEYLINLEYDNKIEKVYTPEIRSKVDAIEADRLVALVVTSDGMDKLRGDIKEEVIQHGESVRGDYLRAQYSKPRITWDTKGLDGYRVAHPEIDAFRRIGKPSVSFRNI